MKCTGCVHQIGIPGDCHIGCANPTRVIRRQWPRCGVYPLKFDPGIIVECAGHSTDPADRKPADDPFTAIARILL